MVGSTRAKRRRSANTREAPARRSAAAGPHRSSERDSETSRDAPARRDRARYAWADVGGRRQRGRPRSAASRSPCHGTAKGFRGVVHGEADRAVVGVATDTADTVASTARGPAPDKSTRLKWDGGTADATSRGAPEDLERAFTPAPKRAVAKVRPERRLQRPGRPSPRLGVSLHATESPRAWTRPVGLKLKLLTSGIPGGQAGRDADAAGSLSRAAARYRSRAPSIRRSRTASSCTSLAT
jgi:hypothetical protein